MAHTATVPSRRVPVATPIRIGYRDIVRGLRQVGLNRNSRVVVHASLSSFGHVIGGQETVVGALIAVCGTVVIPTFTYQTMVTPQTGPENNGLVYGETSANSLAEFWRPALPAHKSIGVISNTLLRHPAAKRSTHPVMSFAAVGRDAAEALAGQTLSDPLAPLLWLADNAGDVLLLGVTHRANTMIHVGEQRAGRKRFVRWALTPRRIEAIAWPGDSSGFDAIAPAIRHFTVRGQIGTANVQRIPARELVNTVEALIRKDPTALLCHNKDCERCQDVRATIGSA